MCTRITLCLTAIPLAALSMSCDKKESTSTHQASEMAQDPAMSELPGMPGMPAVPDAMRSRISIQPTDPMDPNVLRVVTDGMSVWPPVGPGCDRLVACCQAAAGLDQSIGLFCQLSVAGQAVRCGQSLGRVKQYMAERKVTAPSACAEP